MHRGNGLLYKLKGKIPAGTLKTLAPWCKNEYESSDYWTVTENL